jgi:predicted ABC-type ATPase
LVAGANGSGKSTLTRWGSSLFQEIPVLDPDAIENMLQSSVNVQFPLAGARQVLKSASEHLSNSRSFAVETTLSGKNYLRMMFEARRIGFEVVLVYIGTENVELNLARIRNRVLTGGHDVPEADVRRRYQRTSKIFPLPPSVQTTQFCLITPQRTDIAWSPSLAPAKTIGSQTHRHGPLH